jgi:DNA-binding GntR family transcriptional regulator
MSDMKSTMIKNESKSTADEIFDKLYEDIVTLKILPGSKISETEVARRLGVSRQPTRDAFRRLHNLELLQIRPQRASVVRRFSLAEIQNIRFLRLAIELEVLHKACKVWNSTCEDVLNHNLTLQAGALQNSDASVFHNLDDEFHRLICEQVDSQMAFETIINCKHKISRLCVLSLSNHETANDIFEDHRAIADALARKSEQDAQEALRKHVSRLDPTIVEIHQNHQNYFQ